MNLCPRGGNYRTLRKYIGELGLTTSHFTPCRPWNWGRKAPRAQRKTLQDLLTVDSDCGTNRLRKKLIESHLKSPCCEECGWAKLSPDGRLPLELDHINGDPRDNRLENLRVLCPNCHSLKPTHRGCNRRRRPGGETGSHATLKMS